MVRIPGFESRVAAQGNLQGGYTPDAFGAGALRTMSQIAGAAGQAAQHYQNIQDDEAMVSAYDLVKRTTRSWDEELNKRVKSINPEDAEASNKLVEDMQAFIADSRSKVMESISNKKARMFVEQHLASGEDATMRKSMAEQSNIAAARSGAQADRALEYSVVSAAEDYSNESYQREVGSSSDLIDSLNTIDADRKLELKSKQERKIAYAQSESYASANPAQFIKNCRPGQPITTVPSAPTASTKKAPQMSVDDVLAKLTKQESGGKQFDKGGGPLTSKAGAIGVMQIMPETGPEAAKLAGLPWDLEKLRTDAVYNRALGTAYFKDMLKRQGGDMAKALAAYNAGPTAVADAVIKAQASGKPEAWLSYLPKETQQYVPAILGSGASGGSTASQSSVPQMQPLTIQEIAASKQPIDGWDRLPLEDRLKISTMVQAEMGKNLASSRAKVRDLMGDSKADAASGKAAFDYKQPEVQKDFLVATFGEYEGKRIYDEFQTNRNTGEAIKATATMPTAQLTAMVAAMEPKGGEGSEYTLPMYNHLRSAAQQRETLIKNDWIAYAQAHNFGVAPLDMSSPETLGETIKKRKALAVSGAAEFGAIGFLPFSKNEMSVIEHTLPKLASRDQLAYLSRMWEASQDAPQVYHSIMHKLSENNPQLPIAAMTATKGGSVTTSRGTMTGRQVATYMLEGNLIAQGLTPEGKEKTGRPVQIDDKSLNSLFWRAVGPNAFSGPDPAASSVKASRTYTAVKNYLYADIYRNHGGDARAVNAKMVDDAVTAVTGGYVNINGTSLSVPWGMPHEDFSRQFMPAVRRSMEAAGLTGSQWDHVGYLRFANSEEDGVYHVTDGEGKVILGKTGMPVVVDMRYWDKRDAHRISTGEYDKPEDQTPWFSYDGMVVR